MCIRDRVSAALLAGHFSYINMLIAKDQKTTEFRHESISSLRNEISKFISNASVLSSMVVYMHKHGTIDFDKFILDNMELLKDLQASYSRIQMMVNPNEDAEFLTKLESVHKYVSGNNGDFELSEVNSAEQELITATQVLLKKEWTRIKSGEFMYRVAKWGTLLFLASLTILVISYLNKVLPLGL